MVLLSSNFIKCVVLGDDSVGKTSLLMNYATNRFPTQHVPSVFDNYAGKLEMSGKTYHLQLLDTVQEDPEKDICEHVYPGTDIFVVCYSVAQPESFKNVREKWVPHIKRNMGEVPFILVGTQTDLRSDCNIQSNLQREGKKCVTTADGFALSRKLGASRFIEISPELEKSVKRMLNKAIGTVLHPRDGLTEHMSCTIL